MIDMGSDKPLSRGARTIAIREILAYEVEESEGAMFPDEEENLLNRLVESTDRELEDEWGATVGEFLSAEGFDPERGWEAVVRGQTSGFVPRYQISWNG